MTHLLWDYTDGRIALWNVDTNNNFLSNVGFGPYAGWSVQDLAVAPDGTTRLLWGHTSGLACLWTLNAADAPTLETNLD